MYGKKGGGNCFEAPIISFGITDEQLIFNLAPRLSKYQRGTSMKLVSNRGTLAERRKFQSTPVETVFAIKKKHDIKKCRRKVIWYSTF